VPGFFDDEPSPAEIENEYIEAMIPVEGLDLWERSTDGSPIWDSMTPEQHMMAADMFAQAAYSGSIYEAEDFTNFLDIEWDNSDIADYWDMYDALAG
jgi:hypothetical protein